MWECKYAKEALDLRLLFLRLAKHIWILLSAALLGALLWGAGYYIANVALAGPPLYEKTSIYYVDYGTAPLTDNAFTYINAYTWNEWVHTDEFTDGIAEQIRESGYELSGEEIKAYFSANLPSDLRMPYSTVTTPDPQLTQALGEALEQAFVAFGERQREIESIRVSDSGAVARAANDDRTLRAVILGAVTGFFAALVLLLLLLIADTSVYLPETFSYRYGIPALGILYAHGEKEGAGTPERPEAPAQGAGLEMRELAENLAYVFQGRREIALTALEPETDLAKIAEELPGKEFAYICVPPVGERPEEAKRLREAEGVLLLVKAGARNGKQIEHTLDFMKIQGITVDGALLYNGDRRLNRIYRMQGQKGRLQGQKRHLPRAKKGEDR